MDAMTSAKVEVIWSPVHHNKFVVWGPDITLYEVGRIKDIEKKTTFIPISSSNGASVVASHSAHGVRCVDLSAMPDLADPLLACGFANGRVGLVTLKQMYDPMGWSGRVYPPKYPRLCNSVSWSHSETNMLAVAMDKHRSDHCILIWDVHRDTLPWNDSNDSSPPEQPKPLAEMGLSETAHSVSWANCGYRTLIASMNLKYIKVFDLRDWSNKAVSSTGRGQWFGAVAAPSGFQLAARAEAGAAVWDLRAMQRPLLTLHHPKPVMALHWSPTKRNLLLTLQKDSSSVRLYDIQQAHNNEVKNNSSSCDEVVVAPAVEADVEEYCVGGAAGAAAGAGATALEREVTPGGAGQALAAVSWHPAQPSRLLAVAAAGAIHDYTVCERVTAAWGAGPLAFTAPPSHLKIVSEDFNAQLKDISYIMKQRAQTDYGLKPDLWQNADLAEDESLSAMWHFLALSKSLVEDGCIRGSPWRHPGVAGVVLARGAAYRSEGSVVVMADVPARRVLLHRSAERTRALQLCGWGWGWESSGAGVERAEAEGTPCRAAALAAFHLRVHAALDVLARAREPQLRVVALALAGLGDERLWRDALAAARPALPDAYLRALLAFLAASQPAAAPQGPPPDYSAVLAETEMRLEDRVAFACVYLDDARLRDWLAWTQEELVRRGELAGLLLTGVSPDGVALLSAWLQRTGDVQTAALVAARAATPDLLQSPTVQHWLDSYRMILDSWQLWWARCALDAWTRAEPEGRPLTVACTYCGKSVATPRPPSARLPPPAAKMKQVSSCPNCRKPLPRCAVCALHLGTAAGGAPFAAWFSWCVSCRHGGHAQHIIDWFSEHSECPVSSCNCHCSSLDPPDRHC